VSRLARLALFASAISVGSALHAAPLELTLWHHEREDIHKVLLDVIATFEKDNKDIKIKMAQYKTEDLRTQFQTAAMGGGGADLVLAPNDFGGPFSVMGIIQSVESWAGMDKFSTSAVQAVTDSRGKAWGVPVSRGNHLILFVNGNIVPKAPTTLEELVEVARKHTNEKQKRFGFAYNLTEPFWFVTFLAAWGQRPLVDGKPQLGGDAMASALGFVRGLKFDSKVVPADCDYACADTLFTEGKAAMTINGDWAVQQYREKLGDKLIIAALPQSKATGQWMAPMVSGKYLFFNKRLSGKKLDAAKTWANWLVTPAVQETLLKKTQRLPSLKAMEGSPVIKADPVLAATESALAHGQPMPLDVEMRVVWDAIRPQLQNVMAGRADAKVAAATMQKDAEVKIKEMRQ
jgi:arabinogalactan oligomer/maltooligosaccharide transport system substrate-binding protein